MTFVHADLDDFPAAVAEAARILWPGGRLGYLGVHPCFLAAFLPLRLTGVEGLDTAMRPWRRGSGGRPGRPVERGDHRPARTPVTRTAGTFGPGPPEARLLG